MAEQFSIYKKCTNCKGTGVIVVNDEYYDPGPPSEVPCDQCNGTGYIFWGYMEEGV